MGAQVTIVQRADRLVDREDPRVGELAGQALSAAGVTVRTGVTPVSARTAGGTTVVTLDDGSQVETDVVILGAGRRPATDGFGLDTAGVTLTGRGGIAVDDRCRAGPGVWAAGDVTGISLFTHVATYQGRVVADNILGRDRGASYEGIPRVVFADPEIAAVGLTAAQAAGRGIRTATAEISIADAADRSWTYERDPRGAVGLLADRDRGVLALRRPGDPRPDPHRHPPGPGRPVPHLHRGLPGRAGTTRPVTSPSRLPPSPWGLRYPRSGYAVVASTGTRLPRGPVTLLPARPASCSCPRPTGAAAPSWPVPAACPMIPHSQPPAASRRVCSGRVTGSSRIPPAQRCASR